ncbi:hypothetical protein J7E91_00940 [Streptomyces sp. ISL-99]|nr:hypothetical protein [Streptomyces sp. ISL-99]
MLTESGRSNWVPSRASSRSLAAALTTCLKHAADETRIRGWIAELESAVLGIEDLRRRAAALRASGRHP